MNALNTITHNRRVSIYALIATIVLMLIAFFGFIPFVTLVFAAIPVFILAFLPLALIAMLLS